MAIYSFWQSQLSALSAFRFARTKAACAAQGLTLIETRVAYLLQSETTLDANATQQLQQLLETPEPKTQPTRAVWAVMPRLGTLSPWSSKATDIAHNCGLESITRLEKISLFFFETPDNISADQLNNLHIFDPMTESLVYLTDQDLSAFLANYFKIPQAGPRREVDVLQGGLTALMEANQNWGLALATTEMEYLVESYRKLGKNPSDAELMMFGQINSEHCRHKIFNASWEIDGEKPADSLFQMIRHTHANAPEGVLSAYKDNAAVIAGFEAERFWPDQSHGAALATYTLHKESAPILMKVETHNHPTAISPFAGAATGVGGELRDEGATGRGGKPKAGLSGFSVSNLRLPNAPQPWEGANYGKPGRIVTPLQIMIEAPIGAAAYNNEFGRPNLTGYFRSFEMHHQNAQRGYHKPIMIAGGYGHVRADHVEKKIVAPGTAVVILGGPALLIGLGGGAASSMTTGQSSEQLDFASVQRANPELERRCQEVIDRCFILGEHNPIISIHDVGAGGLSNAVPEILHDNALGGNLDLRRIPCADPSLSPMEIWCNEAQERYVLAIAPEDLPRFGEICARERAPWAAIGTATAETTLLLTPNNTNTNTNINTNINSDIDDINIKNIVDLPMDTLLGKTPRWHRQTHRHHAQNPENPENPENLNLNFQETAENILKHPSVGSKQFLITIGDRTVGGMTARDQFVGSWQTPVADVAVTTTGYVGFTGEAMSMGERSPLALTHAAASARMAIGESISNLLAANIAIQGKTALSAVRLSCNWMAACGHGDEDARLFDAVHAASQLCQEIGIAVPVGKDSLSMKTVWQTQDESKAVISPVSLVVSAFAPVTDARRTLIPVLQNSPDTLLILIAPTSQQRLYGAIAQQVQHPPVFTGDAPDINNTKLFLNWVRLIQDLAHKNQILAYHDRSDGGAWAAVCEMAFAARCGLDLVCDAEDPSAFWFNEEIGAILQIQSNTYQSIKIQAEKMGLFINTIGTPTFKYPDITIQNIIINEHDELDTIFKNTRVNLQKFWTQTSHEIARLRDNPACADSEFAQIENPDAVGLLAGMNIPANYAENINKINKNSIVIHKKPKIAILREQGVNGQNEMAFAFHRAGFEAVDVHMSDLLAKRTDLSEFRGLVACGGFSYGDVLGAGQGWAKSILFNPVARQSFAEFFARENTFSLGVCNGCQMLASLKTLIPGADHWQTLERNLSEQFEARFSLVEILATPSIFLENMAGWRLPVAVAHGEGRMQVAENGSHLTAMRFVDHRGLPTENYPDNPNGSTGGVTCTTSEDGRATILMPHPERVIRNVTWSVRPNVWEDEMSPWFQMFLNAAEWARRN